jgi:dTDP-4-amino-4,6-dideoxygalactose transaminase
MNAFASDPKELVSKQLEAVKRVFDSGWFILGREVREFERAWAAYCGVREAVGVANGMDAIEIALRALNIGPGDEVITTPMTAFASVLAILRAGAEPVFADIDSGTALQSLESVRRCVSSRTKAVLLVHLYGQVRNLDQWRDFCDSSKILLIEDCAQAHGAQWRGRKAGAWGSCGAFSFYPTKNLGTVGDGGALVSDDPAVCERSRVLRNYGQSERYHHPVVGLNSRLDELHAAILKERLAWLDRFTARRREIGLRYLSEIRNPAVRPMDPPLAAENHVFHLFVVRCDSRDLLIKHLKENGVESLIHYPVSADRQPPGSGIRRDPKGLESSHRHAESCLSVPCHHNLLDGEVTRVVEALNEFRPGR